MKKLMPLSIILVLIMTLVVQHQGSANAELNQIDQKIAQAKRDAAAAQKNAAQAKNKISEIKKLRVENLKSLDKIYAEIDDAEAELERLNGEIVETEHNLAEAEIAIAEAVKRIEGRDELLRSRLRLIYTNGAVSYMEVLLSATSFSDFLSRYTSLQSLVNQDKEILESNIRDHQIIVENKNAIETQLVQLAGLYEQQEVTIAGLLVKEKDAEVAIASLNQEEEYFGEISEEQEQLAMELITLQSKLEQERKKIIEYYKGGKLAYPLPDIYRISSSFGPRTHPVTGKKGSVHTGIDFAAPNGTNILAAESGRVVTAANLGGYGNTVAINHGGNLMTLYAHIRPNGIKVKEGDEVKRGDVIAEVGTTGTSTGYHLHFEVRLDGVAVDPKKYLNLK